MTNSVDLSGLSPADVPMALRALHRSIRAEHATSETTGTVGPTASGSSTATAAPTSPDSAARADSVVTRVLLPAPIGGVPDWVDVVHLCGFEIASRVEPTTEGTIAHSLRWFETAPATIGPNMRILLIGVNPSPTSAITGIPFARGGNRFWPGLLGAGLGTTDRDPEALLRDHSIGMADISKRVSVRADELTAEEVHAGWARLGRLARWLKPGATAVLGITTYRIATGEKKAKLGWQRDPLGGRPVYVMPNPSGLNAHTNAADMSAHFTAASNPPTR